MVAISVWIVQLLPKLRGEFTSPSLFLQPRGTRLERVWSARLLPALLPSFLSLPSFSSPSPTSFTFNLMDQLFKRKNRNRVSRLEPCQNLSPRRKAFKILVSRDLASVSTKQHLHGVNYNRGSACSRGRTGEGQRHWRLKKNDRDRNTLITGNSLRVPSLQAAKFECQPIKLELYPLEHTYPANYVRVHFRDLGVYKES